MLTNGGIAAIPKYTMDDETGSNDGRTTNVNSDTPIQFKDSTNQTYRINSIYK